MSDSMFVVSECCPVGCSTEVVLLRDRQLGTAFAYCQGCGCTWLRPSETQFTSSLDEVVSLGERAPSGVDLPSWAELSSSSFARSIRRTMTNAEWGTSTQELNALIDHEVSKGIQGSAGPRQGSIPPEAG